MAGHCRRVRRATFGEILLYSDERLPRVVRDGNDLPLPDPDTEALDRLLSYTLDSDLFGHSRDHAVIELRNEKDEAPSRSRVLRKMLFPPAAEIESRYIFLQNRHWLLPLAWLVRLFANLHLIPSRIRQMKQVTKTDKVSVETYDGFMRRIGL